MFAFSINLDLDKLKEADSKTKKKKKGSRRTQKATDAVKSERKQIPESKNS